MLNAKDKINVSNLQFRSEAFDLTTQPGPGRLCRFMKQVGVHPKLYARIVRFEAALDSKARASTKSWADVACEFGYFDQMHMIHDFKSFARGTPTDILTEVEALFRDQIQAIRSGHRSVTAGDDLELIL